MFTLVIDASASGKSDYAERFVLSQEGSGPLIYIATMEPFGKEAQARIARHHAMRRDRGFETLECYRNIGNISVPKNSSVLLEDLGNLVANELFGGYAFTEEEKNALPERIAEEINALRTGCAHLTIVTNEVFSGGKNYEGDTLSYLMVLAKLGRLLAMEADYVVEVVCGLPDVLKEPAE